MFTIIPFNAAARNLAGGILSGLFTVVLTSVAFAGEPGTSADSIEPRQSTSEQYVEGGRAKSPPTVTTEDRYEPLVTQGERVTPGKSQGSSKTAASGAEASRNDFWIYYADVELFYDDDNDGYFYGIDVLFDADTYFDVADVYAVLFLSLEGGPWNEYAVTDTFSIFGATSDDEYVVVTELDSGYPTGSYDLLIELYDAYDGEFLASLGPSDTSELSFLPLEDFNRDDPLFDGPRPHFHDGGGGATGLPALAFLAMFTLAVYARSFRERGRRGAPHLRPMRAEAIKPGVRPAGLFRFVRCA